jgi:Zn-dependent M28 family amino/carboxypeptidase
MMEAMRILKTLDLKPARTVRLALWTGEEQGLLGSRAYVTQHFADRHTMQVKAEHAKLSGYFNFDNGTGRIRGVYLQGNDMMRPVFSAWLAPFRDLGATTISIRDTARPTILRSMLWACRGSSSSRIRWNTPHELIIPTWTCSTTRRPLT